MRLPVSSTEPIELGVVAGKQEAKLSADVLLVLSPDALWEVSYKSLMIFNGMTTAVFAHVQRSWISTLFGSSSSFADSDVAEKNVNSIMTGGENHAFPFVVCDGSKTRDDAAFGAAQQLRASLIVVPPVKQNVFIPSAIKSTPAEILLHRLIASEVRQCGIWMPRNDAVDLCSVGPIFVLLDLDRLAFRQPPLVAQLALRVGSSVGQPVHFLGYFAKPMHPVGADSSSAGPVNENWMDDLKVRRAASLEILGTLCEILKVPGDQMHLCDEDPVAAVCNRLPSMSSPSRRPLVCFARYPPLLLGQRLSHYVSFFWRDLVSTLTKNLSPLADLLITV